MREGEDEEGEDQEGGRGQEGEDEEGGKGRERGRRQRRREREKTKKGEERKGLSLGVCYAYLPLEHDVFPLPVFQQAVELQSANNVITAQPSVLADIWRGGREGEVG